VTAKQQYTNALQQAHQANTELRHKFLKDFQQEKGIKKMGFLLLKNTDTENMIKRFAEYKNLT